MMWQRFCVVDCASCARAAAAADAAMEAAEAATETLKKTPPWCDEHPPQVKEDTTGNEPLPDADDPFARLHALFPSRRERALGEVVAASFAGAVGADELLLRWHTLLMDTHRAASAEMASRCPVPALEEAGVRWFDSCGSDLDLDDLDELGRALLATPPGGGA